MAFELADLRARAGDSPCREARPDAARLELARARRELEHLRAARFTEDADGAEAKLRAARSELDATRRECARLTEAARTATPSQRSVFDVTDLEVARLRDALAHADARAGRAEADRAEAGRAVSALQRRVAVANDAAAASDADAYAAKERVRAVEEHTSSLASVNANLVRKCEALLARNAALAHR